MRMRVCLILGAVVAGGGLAFVQGTQAFAQTFFEDSFDTGASSQRWTPIPGQINAIPNHKLEGSSTSGNHDHTGNGGQAAVAFPANPTPYGAYHEFDPQPAHIPLRLGVWVYDEGHDSYCPNEDGVQLRQQTRGLVGLTTVPGEDNVANPPSGAWGPHIIYEYEDWAFLGVELRNMENPTGPNATPEQFHYRWYTKTDGWHTTTVVRKANPVCGGPTVWKHFEIVLHPYTGNVGDIQFFIDGQLVGEGRRDPGPGGQGAEFRRISMGTRFPQNSDLLDPNWGPPLYSYEFYRFDDVTLGLVPLDCHVPRFDADDDGDVDQVDFGVWQSCFTGVDDPDGWYDRQVCGCMNSDGDADIDPDDWGAFLACLSGPGIPAPTDCDAGLPPP